MRNVLFHPIAKRELEYSAQYYETQSQGLGKRFLSEIEKGLNRIQAHPDAWPPFVSPGLRRYLLHYFPYAILYKNTPDHLYVLALMHLSREPGYWRERL